MFGTPGVLCSPSFAPRGADPGSQSQRRVSCRHSCCGSIKTSLPSDLLRRKRDMGIERWQRSARYWKTVPRSTDGMILAGIFCLFSCMGLAICMVNVLVTPVPWALGLAAISGGFAVGWAYLGFRALWKWMLVLGPLQFAATSLFSSLLDRHV